LPSQVSILGRAHLAFSDQFPAKDRVYEPTIHACSGWPSLQIDASSGSAHQRREWLSKGKNLLTAQKEILVQWRSQQALGIVRCVRILPCTDSRGEDE
jgi:hypothetical protein